MPDMEGAKPEAAKGEFSMPEQSSRLPIALLAVVSAYTTYKGCSGGYNSPDFADPLMALAGIGGLWMATDGVSRKD